MVFWPVSCDSVGTGSSITKEAAIQHLRMFFGEMALATFVALVVLSTTRAAMSMGFLEQSVCSTVLSGSFKFCLALKAQRRISLLLSQM